LGPAKLHHFAAVNVGGEGSVRFMGAGWGGRGGDKPRGTCGEAGGGNFIRRLRAEDGWRVGLGVGKQGSKGGAAGKYREAKGSQ